MDAMDTPDQKVIKVKKVKWDRKGYQEKLVVLNILLLMKLKH